MAGQETLVLLAIFDDIAAADVAVDSYWDWSESQSDRGPEAIGILARLEWGLDAQLLGEDGHGTDTGPALDVLEALLGERSRGAGSEYGANPEQLAATLMLDSMTVSQLRDELGAGRALMVLALDGDVLQASRGHLDGIGGQTSVIAVPRAALLQAASALSGEADDDDLYYGYEEQGATFGGEDDYEGYDDPYEFDDDEESGYGTYGPNGRYR